MLKTFFTPRLNLFDIITLPWLIVIFRSLSNDYGFAIAGIVTVVVFVALIVFSSICQVYFTKNING